MNIVDKVNFVYMVVAGGVIHLFVDWFLQNNWMATNKAKRRVIPQLMHVTSTTGDRVESEEWVPLPDAQGKWYERHEAAWAHAGLHALFMLLVFPFWAAMLIGTLHLIIDTRTPLDWWGRVFKQTTDPKASVRITDYDVNPPKGRYTTYYGIGTHVAIWRDQVAHIVVIALVALLCVL